MRGISCCCLGMLVLLAGAPASAITLGQVDNFQAGTLQSWGGGSGPLNVPTGGPAGASDRYLVISESNGNLGITNTVQWAGDYANAGVTALRLTLQNQGSTTLALRITVFGPGAATAYTSIDELELAPGSGWVTAEFALTESALQLERGTESLAQTLAGVSKLLLRHDPDPISAPAEQNPVTGTLGIDDVTAVPEPGTALLVLTGLALLTRAPRARTGA